MMLKKQTVWLLTMLSLLIVLSVYYMTSDGGDQFALVDVEEDQDGTEGMNGDDIETTVEGTGEVEFDENGNPIGSTSTDEMFTYLRMELQDKRSRQKEMYQEIMVSSSATTDQKNDAMDAMNRLEEVRLKEAVLEKVIQTDFNYEDVLVRAEDDVVHVTVKAENLSPTEIVNIMQMVYDEFGQIEVQVKVQPGEEEQ